MENEQKLAHDVINSAQSKQEFIVNHFKQVLEKQNLSHAYLFSGEDGSGKMAVALMISMAMFCPNVKNGIPCGNCNECKRIASKQHPDVMLIEPKGRNIRIDQVRLLKSEFSKSAVEGNQKVFIINGADKMTTEAANSLLKFIEEPVGNVFSFLLTNNKLEILLTILSRTQVVEFPSLSNEKFNKELESLGIGKNQFNLIATMTNDLTTAKKWSDDDWFYKLQSKVSDWFLRIIDGDYRSFVLVQTSILPLVNTHYEYSIVVNMMIQAWRDVLDVKFRSLEKQSLKFPENYSAIKRFAGKIRTSQLLKIMQLILKDNIYLERNVNFQNIIEATTLETLTVLNM